jgi:hypothetical protein
MLRTSITCGFRSLLSVAGFQSFGEHILPSFYRRSSRCWATGSGEEACTHGLERALGNRLPCCLVGSVALQKPELPVP